MRPHEIEMKERADRFFARITPKPNVYARMSQMIRKRNILVFGEFSAGGGDGA